MTGSRITTDELASSIAKYLGDYGNEAREALMEILEEEAKKGAKEVRSGAAGLFGDGGYAKGWTFKKISDLSWVIHNKKHYQLVHLLEKGHDIVRNGKVVGHAGAYPHVKPVEQKILGRIAEDLKRRLG